MDRSKRNELRSGLPIEGQLQDRSSHPDAERLTGDNADEPGNQSPNEASASSATRNQRQNKPQGAQHVPHPPPPRDPLLTLVEEQLFGSVMSAGESVEEEELRSSASEDPRLPELSGPMGRRARPRRVKHFAQPPEDAGKSLERRPLEDADALEGTDSKATASVHTTPDEQQTAEQQQRTKQPPKGGIKTTRESGLDSSQESSEPESLASLHEPAVRALLQSRRSVAPHQAESAARASAERERERDRTLAFESSYEAVYNPQLLRILEGGLPGGADDASAVELFGGNPATTAATAADAGEATDLDAEQLPFDDPESASKSGLRASKSHGSRRLKLDSRLKKQ